jgi:hypothetical protein
MRWLLSTSPDSRSDGYLAAGDDCCRSGWTAGPDGGIMHVPRPRGIYFAVAGPDPLSSETTVGGRGAKREAVLSVRVTEGES